MATAEQAEHRLLLPVPMYHSDYSIWSVLKNCIGKELSKITMPVVFNEPLSFLQRMSEYMEYSHLLRIASEQQDPLMRMQFVVGFAVSALASNWERLGKPFNPLLGETYELERKEFRIVCEQVSHHPPVSAFHADNNNWVFHGSIHPKLKFWGKNVEIQPKGVVTVEFPKLKEAYTWTNVQCCVHNVIVGKLWMEQCGTMEIINHSTGHRAHLTFKPAGSNSRDLHHVEGYIADKSKHKLLFVYGKWTEYIKCCDYSAYEEHMKEQCYKLKKDGETRSKSPNESPSHNTSRKMLQKFNSLKVSPFKSNVSQESVDDSLHPDDPDGSIPKSESSYSIDIPHSTEIWRVNARPLQTSDVSTIDLTSSTYGSNVQIPLVPVTLDSYVHDERRKDTSENTGKCELTYYQFTQFAMSLNEIESGMEKNLCPTDSRLRPDIRKLEQGDIDGAAIEKTRLEEKQRDANKLRKSKKGIVWTPRWFQHGVNLYTKQEDWLFTGEYWNREFADNPDIF